jgi:hypothetical protein
LASICDRGDVDFKAVARQLIIKQSRVSIRDCNSINEMQRYLKMFGQHEPAVSKQSGCDNGENFAKIDVRSNTENRASLETPQPQAGTGHLLKFNPILSSKITTTLRIREE